MKLLVIGESGSGKSYSMRNLNWDTTFLISTIRKEVPFKAKLKPYKDGKGNTLTTQDPNKIIQIIRGISDKMPKVKTLVIDDAQYIMVFEYMARAKERGFDKFVDIAQKFFSILNETENIREDLDVIFLAHSTYDSLNGYRFKKMKTIGKMLDDVLTIEGLFTVVLTTDVMKDSNDKIFYQFLTQSDGTSTAKSPIGMFDLYEENDLNLITNKIHNFYADNYKWRDQTKENL